MGTDEQQQKPPSDDSRPGSNGHGGEEDEWKDLLRKTQDALERGDNEQALSTASAMLQRASKLGETHHRFWSALRFLGDVHLAMNSTQEAEEHYTRYLGLVKSHEGDEMLQVLVNFAAVQIQSGKVADAAFSLQRALLRAGRRRHAYSFINRTFGKLEDGLSEEQLVKSKRIAEIYQRITEAAARAFGTDATEYGVALGNWGIALHLQKKDAEAEPKLKQAIALTQQNDDEALNAARCLERLAAIFRAQSLPDKAEEALQKALALREDIRASSD